MELNDPNSACEGGGAPATPPRTTSRALWRRYFVIPFSAALLVLTAVWIFAAGREDPSAEESLATIQSGQPRARWRAAGALARALADPARVPHDPAFAAQLLTLFGNHALQDVDQRIHLYLALAMGRVADATFYSPLLAALHEATADSDEQAVYIRALGLMQDPRAVPELLPLLGSDATVVRHETVQALGCIGDAKARAGLQAMLDDPEANVQWDAAVALAKMGDPSGKVILLKLLDRTYYEELPTVRGEGCNWAMEIALRTGAQLNDPEINQRIRQIATSDPSVHLRGVALEVVDAYKLEG
ncbi:MAG: HEAT repeat domain-containing protein [Lentisphaerae bacterium]|nr:HEAT repeat domain-containing protein [Lentisphaerota bacterium]